MALKLGFRWEKQGDCEVAGPNGNITAGYAEQQELLNALREYMDPAFMKYPRDYPFACVEACSLGHA
jgi:hypothetical protein